MSMQRMRRSAKVVVVGRLLAVILLLVGRLLLAVPSAVSARHPVAVLDATIGAAIFGAWTLVWIVSALLRPDADITAMLTMTAVVDGVALGLLTSATCGLRDPFLAWYLTEAILFSLLLRRRRAWVLGGLLTLSYLSGHALSGQALLPLEYIFLAASVVSIPIVSFAVALILGGQEEYREALEDQRVEVTDLNRRLERSVSELRAVTEITELIHSTLEIETVGPTLLEILERVINIPAASLYVIDKDKQETIFAASSVGGGASPRPYSGLELAGALPVGTSDGALSCIELVDHNQTVVVFCADAGSMAALTSDDKVVLTAVASELVVGVENSRLYRLTKRLAITDELSDLYNYRFLQQRLDDEIGRADRYNKRLSLLMLDLDDFKHVNDTHGHRVGDTVLFEIGQLLKSTVREVDVVTRYGGEEFTIILPETDASGAFIVAEKIREAISLHRFPDGDGGRSIHLTVSIGLAAYPVHATDKDTLLRAADDAVYRAKESGKDRVRAPRLRLRRLGPDAITPEEASE